MTPISPQDGTPAAKPLTRVPQPRGVPEMTTSAMEAFVCLADTCPDTCCRDWAVPIDRADLERMTTAMSTTPEGRERLVRLVVIGRPSRGSDALAQINLGEDGGCPMLEADQRCGVHATLGEPALTTACSIFPRTALAVADHLEVGGSLGCPEVARLMLLSERPPRLQAATKPMLPRAYVGKTISADAADAYAHHFLEVRAALLACFQSGRDLGVGLAVAADFAARVEEFFHAGTREFDGAQRPFSTRRLRAEIDATAGEMSATALASDLTALDVSGEATTGVIAGFLLERRQLPHGRRFAELLEQVFSPFMPGEPAATELWRVYAQRRAALHTRAGARLDRIFGNYCQHFLLRNPFTDAPTLLEYLYRLGVHVGAVRLLTVLHPDLEALLAAAPDETADAQTVERVAIHVAQTFTKAISHHPEYLVAALHQPRPPSFGRLVLLAKFL